MIAAPSISFVIPVRNDAKRLRRCLSSIAANAHPGVRIETIVVDNGSTDASAAVAREAGAVVLSRPDAGVAQLRNDGASVSQAPLVAFVDADHELDPGWVAAALELFADSGVSAAGAHYAAPTDANWVQRAYDGLRQRSAEPRRAVEWLPSGNFIVRKSTFVEVGGFDASLYTCEDVDFCRRLRAAGHGIVSDLRLRSVHLGDPSSLKAVFMGELWRGRDSLKASLRPPISVREIPSMVIPVVDLLLLAIGVLALFSGSTIGVLISGLTLAGFTALAGLRAVVMVNRLARPTMRDGAAVFAVAVVYDAARALALLAQPGHAVRRRG